MSRRWCVLCLGFEDEACQHDWIDIPDGCVCPPETWTDVPSIICNRFAVDGEFDGVCATCEHEMKCHP
jgi:hypothetical protein